VALRPGKPFLFGKLGQSLVFGLPGNPVSAFVTFLRFVRPALLRLAGCTATDDVAIPAVSGEALRNDGDRPHYVRVRYENGKVHLSGRQESHTLFALSQANALVRLAPGQVVQPGETVDAFRFSP
jgi:molybdopterin molybdotransferase